jgi:hypothetical protein
MSQASLPPGDQNLHSPSLVPGQTLNNVDMGASTMLSLTVSLVSAVLARPVHQQALRNSEYPLKKPMRGGQHEQDTQSQGGLRRQKR